MRTIYFLIFVFAFAYFINKTVSSTETLLPCCNNIDPQTLPTQQTWSFKCGNGSDIIITRGCCIEKWALYGPFPPASTPCACVWVEKEDD